VRDLAVKVAYDGCNEKFIVLMELL
jgi:hypothetical protein